MAEQGAFDQTNNASLGEESDKQKERLTVVGIGASAGGLPALQTFFNVMPPDTGMAFVVVTHLHPDRESLMGEILQLRTPMPVRQVTELLPVEPDHVYLIPPNRHIQMTDTHLDAYAFDEPRGWRMPVDTFFRSLASAHRDAVAIILSGGGTDGSVGIKSIKEQGGLLMVQHPDEAEFSSMPRAAIATGLVDVVLPVQKLALKLIEMRRKPVHLPQRPEQLSAEEQDTLHRVLAQVQARTGHDFSQYKPTTTLRRIQRRMQINGLATLDAYLDYLRHHADEAQDIFNDLLIGVTNFFRDQESWQAVAEQIIPELFKDKAANDSIRTWTIGCATGEEAYTLAMLLMEHAATLDMPPKIQVFASDLDEKSLIRARDGIYPTAIEADVSEERLRRFFTLEGDHYRVRRELRDVVLFATHSVLRDPPFSRLEFISCRNLLIYLRREIQENVYEVFHYALNPGGFLFLGSSESAETLPDLFHTVDKSHRIYRAEPWQGDHPNVPSLPLHIARQGVSQLLNKQSQFSPHRPAFRSDIALGNLHQEQLEVSSPPSILIDEEYNVLHLSETAGRYLLQPKGPLQSDLLQLVRTELKQELRAALFQAFQNKRTIVGSAIPVRFNGRPHRVVLSVYPRLQKDEESGKEKLLALVIFLEDENEWSEEDEHRGKDSSEKYGRDAELVRQLEQEIRYLRERLQATAEEYESSNEEMKAANEELQSINEEYRSATEELETSQEELQSVNEELQTVNLELKNKLEEISRAHSDLENLMVATEIATLFLDRHLRIQRHTPNMETLFNIRGSDRGRPIADLTHRLDYENLEKDARQVLRNLLPIEHEVRGSEGEWFLLRLRPYRTVEDKIDGVVITLVEVTKLKETEKALREMNESLEQLVRQRTSTLDEANQQLSQAYNLFYQLFHANPIPTALTQLEDGLIVDANDAYLRYFDYEREATTGQTKQQLGFWEDENQRTAFINQLKEDGIIRDYEMSLMHPSGTEKIIYLSAQQVTINQEKLLISAFFDISERVMAEQQIQELSSQLALVEQEEKQRLSDVLHNDLQQRLYAVQIQLNLLNDSLEEAEHADIKKELLQLEIWLKETIQITRQLSIDLSPLLENEGLVESLQWLAMQMHEQHALKVSVQADAEMPKLDSNRRILLYEAIRELLFNVVKHANTSEAQIALEKRNNNFEITVSDNGKGFDAGAIFNLNEPTYVGHGLLKVRHRLQLLGIEMKIQSTLGEGANIIIGIPLP